MATPMVAGSIALLLEQDNSLNPDNIQATLENAACNNLSSPSCDNIVDAPNTDYGYGPINVLAAINSITPIDPLEPSLSIDDVSMNEGNIGSTDFIFTVTRSGDTSQTISVNYATGGGSAIAGVDYTSTSGTLNFGSGVTTQQIPISVMGDTDVEPDDTFVVTLSGCSGCTISDGQGIGNIYNDDSSISAISIDDVSIFEQDDGSTDMIFTVTRSGDISAIMSVNYATGGGSATAGVDYASIFGTLFIFGGFSSGQIPVTVYGDTDVEPDETFVVTLSGCSGCTISDGQGIGNIYNDDIVSSPTITIDSPDGGDIEGKIQLTSTVTDISNPQVTYTMIHESGDEFTFGPVTGVPFNASFHTKDYASGNYVITAEASGSTSVTSEPLNVTIPSKGGGGSGGSDGEWDCVNKPHPKKCPQ
jgi:serralysin